ncbi:MAG: PorV/PorQ family protein [Candidatus Zixiibacteriota bacterium]
MQHLRQFRSLRAASRRLLIAAPLLLGMIALGAVDAVAVSQAGALFLRVPVGSRAAGMGQAYVAVADDATATHWNPAGLGASPLSAVWNEISIPEEYRPVRKFVSVKRGTGISGFDGFELWLLGAQGLVVYQGGEWSAGKLYEPAPDESAESILRRYLQTSDDDVVADAMETVAVLNNDRPLEYMKAFEQRALEAMGGNQAWIDEVSNKFVTLYKSYGASLVNWPRFMEAEKRFAGDLKDSEMSERDFDRLSVGLERSVRRYLPEELILPYSLSFDGDLTALESSGKFIWVGTTNGLHRYDGDNWVTFRVKEDKPGSDGTDSSSTGLGVTIPSNHITFLQANNKRLFIGTDKGLVEHFGIGWERVGAESGLPQGVVSGITFETAGRGWAIVDGDVYHLEGGSWKNHTEFTVGIDETPGIIADKFSIYGTTPEKEAYLEKLYEMNASPNSGAEASVDAAQAETTFKPSLGDKIRAPFVAHIKGKVTSLLARNGELWVGTDQGLLSFTGNDWTRFGYRSYTPDRAMTVTELALEITGGDEASAQMVADGIRNQNDLAWDQLEAGETVAVYRNVAASSINDIAEVNGVIYIATDRGALSYDGERLRKFDESGLDNTSTVSISNADESLWYATSDKATFLRQPKRHVSLMHVPWLPELADDINYDFASYMQSVGGAGTFALSLKSLDFGSIQRTDNSGNNVGTEDPRDLALSLSYGLPVNRKLSLGASVKYISSDLADIGAGREVGKGAASGFALDFGLLQRFSDRFSLGVALTNVGPNLSFIDAEQSDPLPLNLAIGYAWKPVKNDLIELMVVTDGNFSLVEDNFEPIFNGGAEIEYGDFIAFRAGRIHDDAGEVKTWTFGAGLRLNIPGIGSTPIDLAYIPSSDDVALSNTLFTSFEVIF